MPEEPQEDHYRKRFVTVTRRGSSTSLRYSLGGLFLFTTVCALLLAHFIGRLTSCGRGILPQRGKRQRLRRMENPSFRHFGAIPKSDQ